MASSSSSSSSSQKELECEVRDGGNKLLMPPSSVDELLNLLDKLETVLNKVEQEPSQSMMDALSPSKKALISNELLRHPDMDVKVSVVSCISEIMRITSPEEPYEDGQMKEIFQLTVMALGKLSDMSGRCYTKATSILHTLAKYRSCLVMLDLECDESIVEMFKHFLRTIRSNHPDEVFSDMETVMTLVLKQSEEISMELLGPLLTSVKKENQKVSPVSCKLGEKVMRNCAAILKPSLRRFAEIVASICQDVCEGENLVEGDLVPDAGGDVQPDETVNDSNSSKALASGCQTNQLEGTDSGVDAQPENLDSSKASKPEAEPEALPKKRDRRPNSLMKPEEGYDHYSWVTFRRKSVELPHRKKKKIGTSSFTLPASVEQAFPPEPEKEDTPHLSSPKTSHDKSTSTSEKHVTEESRRKGSETLSGFKDYGEELVGRSIRVWWPMDQMFYEGVIDSFDPLEKKHKVLYADGDEETLNLCLERWELVGMDILPDPRQVKDVPSTEAISDMPKT